MAPDERRPEIYRRDERPEKQQDSADVIGVYTLTMVEAALDLLEAVDDGRRRRWGGR
jgi:hypothetical protein